ncbi:MAG TPA: cytochrome c [Burkholderiaceae bacterium]|nr:cytochrome c [Burkholderiaceae bacterium]
MALTSLAWGQGAQAQFTKPETAVEYRQAAMFLMGNHMQRIKTELDVSKPNLEVIRASAALLDVLKTVPFEAFVEGTSEIGDTAAKPEIWADPERFKRLARQMQDRVAQLDDSARGGDVAAIRAAFGEAGKACKSCHDDFRKKR